MAGGVQVLDRRFKPLHYTSQPGEVATDCLWSHRLLRQAWLLGTGLHVRDPRFSDLEGNGPQQVAGGSRGAEMVSTTAMAGMEGRNTATPTQHCSVVIRYRKTDGTLRTVGAFGHASTTISQRCDAHINATDGKVYWMFGGTTEGTTQLSATPAAYGEDVWVFTTGTRGMEIWQNGLKVGSNAANPTRAQGANSWGPFQLSTAGSDNAAASVLLMYHRQLSEWEIKQLSIDPWTPFRPAPKRYGIAGLLSGTARVTQSVLEAMRAPDPAARVTQVVAEAMRSPDPSLRATQIVLEAMVPQLGMARVTQLVMEVMVSNASGTGQARISQALAEIMRQPVPPLRATQVVLEVMRAPDTAIRLSQAVAEVMRAPVPPLRVSQVVLEAMVAPGVLSLTYKGQLFPRGSTPLKPA